MEVVPLEAGETITKQYRLHPIALVPPILLAGAAAIGGGIATYLSIGAVSADVYLMWAALGVFLLGLAGVILLVGWFTYSRSRLVITNRHVFTLLQRTLFSQTLTTLALKSVSNAQGDRSGVLQTVLNYGVVRVATFGGNDYFSFQPVGAPEYVATAINDAPCRDHGAPVRAVPLSHGGLQPLALTDCPSHHEACRRRVEAAPPRRPASRVASAPGWNPPPRDFSPPSLPILTNMSWPYLLYIVSRAFRPPSTDPLIDLSLSILVHSLLQDALSHSA